MYKNILFILSFILCVSSCKITRSTTSMGVLNDYKDAVLLTIPPPTLDKEGKLILSKIRVCSDDKEVGDNIVRSIKDWGNIIGRTKYLDIKASCDTKDAAFVINAKGMEQAKSAFVCTGTGELRYRVIPKVEGVINKELEAGQSKCDSDLLALKVDFKKFKKDSTYTKYTVMLHEMGHLWGLCDQYKTLNSLGYDTLRNCSDDFIGHTNNDKKSDTIMGNGAHRLRGLTLDDVAAIQNVANFTNQGTNQQWKTFLNYMNDPHKRILVGFTSSCIEKGYVGVLETLTKANTPTSVFVSNECQVPSAFDNSSTNTDNLKPTDSTVTEGTTCGISKELKAGYEVKVVYTKLTDGKWGYWAMPCRSGIKPWGWHIENDPNNKT